MNGLLWFVSSRRYMKELRHGRLLHKKGGPKAAAVTALLGLYEGFLPITGKRAAIRHDRLA
jgi:hypothetical protein